MSVAEQFIEEDRQEGIEKGMGKIQMLEQFLGLEPTTKEDFESRSVGLAGSKIHRTR